MDVVVSENGEKEEVWEKEGSRRLDGLKGRRTRPKVLTIGHSQLSLLGGSGKKKDETLCGRSCCIPGRDPNPHARCGRGRI